MRTTKEKVRELKYGEAQEFVNKSLNNMSFKKSNPFVKKWVEELEDETQESVRDYHKFNKHGKSEIEVAPFVLMFLVLVIVCIMILSR